MARPMIVEEVAQLCLQFDEPHTFEAAVELSVRLLIACQQLVLWAVLPATAAEHLELERASGYWARELGIYQLEQPEYAAADTWRLIHRQTAVCFLLAAQLVAEARRNELIPKVAATAAGGAREEP